MDTKSIFLSFETNDCELFTWNNNLKELEIYHKDKTDDHDGKVNCIDSIKSASKSPYCYSFNLDHSSLAPKLAYTNVEEHPKTGNGLFVTGGEDGYAKVWTSNKELIREICFPEPINSVCFLNSQFDILVGHGPKVSIISAKDYKPFEGMAEEGADFEEMKEAMALIKRDIVSDRTFEKLKEREDELKSELPHRIKKVRPKKLRNKFEMDESFSFDEADGDDPRKRNIKFRTENDISGISYTQNDDSDEELVTEEMFQRALAATRLELENKKNRKGRSKVLFTFSLMLLKVILMIKFRRKSCICTGELN